MNLTPLVTDDDAVSPVIGVILMVAVTVILAAVIGAFVLGIGSQVTETTPSVTLEFDFQNTNDGTVDNDIATVAHGGGDQVAVSDLNVRVSGDTVSGSTNSACWGTAGVSGSEFTAGDEIEVNEDCGGSPQDLFASNDDFLLVFNGNDGSTAILGEKQVP